MIIDGCGGGVCTFRGGAVTSIITVTATKGMRGEEYAGLLPGHDTIRERIVATIIIIPEFAGFTLVANAKLNPSGLRRKS